MAINLLPKDLLPDIAAVRTARVLKNLLTLGFGIFVIGTIGLVAFFVINSLSIKNSNTRQETIKNSIKSLEQTEQGLVLVEDRLAKVGEVYSKETASQEADNLATIFGQVSQTGTNLSEAVIEKDGLDINFIVTDSTSLSRLLATVVAGEAYQRVELKSFSFNPNVGYLISLGFVTK